MGEEWHRERDTDQVAPREEIGEVRRRGTVTSGLAYFKSASASVMCCTSLSNGQMRVGFL